MFKEPPKVFKRERKSVSDEDIGIFKVLVNKTDYDITPQRENNTIINPPVKSRSVFQKDKETAVNANLLLGEAYTLAPEEEEDRYDSGLPYPLYLFYPSIATQTMENEETIGDSAKPSSEESVLSEKAEVSDAEKSEHRNSKDSAGIESQASTQTKSEDTISDKSDKPEPDVAYDTDEGSGSGSGGSTQLSSDDSLMKGTANEREIRSTQPESRRSSIVSAVAINETKPKKGDAALKDSDFNTLLGSVASTPEPELSVWSLEQPPELKQKRKSYGTAKYLDPLKDNEYSPLSDDELNKEPSKESIDDDMFEG